MQWTRRNASRARSVMSPALPIGVATMTRPETGAKPGRSSGNGLLIGRSSLPATAPCGEEEIARAAAVLDVCDGCFLAMAPTAPHGGRPHAGAGCAGGLRVVEGSHTAHDHTSRTAGTDGAGAGGA